MPSISSRRPCYIPRCVFNEAKRAVPVKFLVSLYAICVPSFNKYFLASPKSIKNNLLDFFPAPTTKLSGLISLCKKVLL